MSLDKTILDILTGKSLTGSDYRVYFHLLRLNQQGKLLLRNQPSLSSGLDIRRTHFLRSLRSLESAGLVELPNDESIFLRSSVKDHVMGQKSLF